jgi:23S rRNA pseudouridine2605 synthase
VTRRNKHRHPRSPASASAHTNANGRNVGLARALSKLGYCSRSQAAEFIRTGRVRLNGRVARDIETPVRLASDRIEVDDAPVRSERSVYYLLNKPHGVITTASDEKGRDTVYAYLPPDTPWVGPVGRLDKASEGLLLLTNDSEWAARITDPATHLDKTYHVHVSGEVSAQQLDEIAKGVALPTGERLRAKSVQILRRGAKNTWLVVVLDEGKNRQIRRIMEALDLQVLQLVRVAIGPLELGSLAKGQCRRLTKAEKEAIDVAIRGSSRASNT